jgi:PAS domain S-box-containing protein
MSTKLSPPPAFTVLDLQDGDLAVDAILELMPGIGVLVVDPDLRIRRMAGAIYERHGFAAADELGRPLWLVLPPEAWAALEEHWAAALDGTSHGLDWASLDGTAEYQLRFSPLCTPDGTVLAAVMIAQDISVQSHAHRRLERRAAQQTVIATLGSIALRGTPLAALTQEAARLVEATLDADIGAVLPYTAAGGLEVHGVSGVPVPPPTGLAPTDPNEIQEFMRFADEPLLIEDIALGALRAPVLEAQGMVSMAIAPIGPAYDRYGLLGACSRRVGAFTTDDLAFLEAMANVLADAMERERSAAEALHREAQLNEAQRLAGVGSWEIDLRTGTYTLSDHLRDMLGLASTLADAETILAAVHVDDRPGLRQLMHEARAHGHLPPAEFRLVLPGGAERIFHSSGAAERDGDRRPMILHGTVQDVTEQRAAQRALERSEERFRKGFDISPIGMTLISPTTGRFLRVNAAYCRFLGRTSEELLALTYADVLYPGDLDGPGRTAFGEGGSDELIADGRYRRPDGTTVWGSIHASRVLGPDGSVDVLFSQVEDITARRAEQEATRRELDQVAWVREIHAALAEDRFELHAQPIVDLQTGETVQQELLLRMRSPDGDLIAPGEFLPAAERYGVVREIDRWVIAHGTELAAGGMNVGINISGASMGDPALVEEIDRALQRTGADPFRLVFEITETAVIEDVDTARRLAEGLRERGCRFALDDFGTGFAGISSLKTLPLDYLKIDRMFVRDLCLNETDRQVISATINLARAFDLQTIAEGVEDQATLDWTSCASSASTSPRATSSGTRRRRRSPPRRPRPSAS